MKIIPILYGLATLAWGAAALPAAELPHLKKTTAGARLIVNGRPFLILGGELHNSSASSLEYLEPVWPRLKAQNLNTVLATVSWELLEPEEGRFDFTLVDGLLAGARRQDLKLVLLWFGSWKNGVSSYVPGWVKKDTARFPRVCNQHGDKAEVLSAFSQANLDADRKAFAALMRHLRETDQKEQTVLMVQVENEAGLLGQPRDLSPEAVKAFQREAPAELVHYFSAHQERLIPEFKKYWSEASGKTNGTWKAVFGEGGEEAFMAWHVARYIGQVAEAGKAAYALPMFANAWLIQNESQKAGQYPSGGPVSKVQDIWRAAAPAIDLLAPDIYLRDFKEVCASYTRFGNPLFIPECGTGADAVAKAFYAFGQHQALGFCPFGIESMPEDRPLKEGYALLSALAPEISRHPDPGALLGIYQQDGEDRQNLQLGGYNLEITFKPGGKKELPGYGLAIASGADEFLVAGAGLAIHFSTSKPGPKYTRILAIDEGWFVNGAWKPGRRLNGDENAGGWRLQIPYGKPSLQRVRLYRHD